MNVIYCVFIPIPFSPFECKYAWLAIFAVSVVISILLVQLLWTIGEVIQKKSIPFRRTLSEWKWTPNVEPRFVFSNPNDLRLRFRNPDKTNVITVEFTYKHFEDSSGKDCIEGRQAEFKLLEGNGISTCNPFFWKQIEPNKSQEIQIGKQSPDGKIALYIGSKQVYGGFPDGAYKYIIGCRAWRINQDLKFERELETWLRIENGILVSIKDIP